MLEIDRLGAVVRDERPWGAFERFTLNEPSTVKIITVNAGQTLSLQRHEHRRGNDTRAGDGRTLCREAFGVEGVVQMQRAT